MRSIQDEDKIQALFPGSPYPAFGICTGVGCQEGRVNDMQAFSLEEGVKGFAELAVIVVDQETCQSFLFIKLSYHLPGLLSYSESIWICSDASQVDTARGQFDEKEHIQGLQPDRFYGKKVASQDLFIVCHQAAPTDGSAANWRRYDAVAFEHIADRGSGSFIT